LVVEAIIKNVQNKLDNVFCEIGISIHENVKKVIEKNTSKPLLISMIYLPDKEDCSMVIF